MNNKILIVEDQFVEANYLRMMLVKAGYTVAGIAHTVVQAREFIKNERPDFVLLDILLKGKLTGIDLAAELAAINIPFVYLSASSNEEILKAAKTTQPYGFLVKPYREKDLLITLEIAQYRHEHSLESTIRREAELFDKLDKIIKAKTAWNEKLLGIGKILQQHIPFDLLTSGFGNPDKVAYSASSFLRIGFDEYQTIGLKELLMITGINSNDLMELQATMGKETEAEFFNGEAFEKKFAKATLKKLFRDTFHMKSHLFLPIHLSSGETFTFYFYSRRGDAYSIEHINLFRRLETALTKSIDQRIGEDNIASIGTVVRQATGKTTAFDGIIGNSHLLLNVFDHITQVAPFDTAVLILGESGTGKEKIADCIHSLSPRNKKTMVKVNCAALPATLIESELFGHEKGAFTGALDKSIGRFEHANGGTIFLDEIGDMPLDLQVKLLRVLQEKEIERIGNRIPVKIDVRIIAATNKNLEKEVAEGRFRLDLYYRLNVFPVTLPPLRERIEDLPGLCNHFINVYNNKAGKKITGLSDKVLKLIRQYHWPGNIRELENIIERSVLLTKGTIIEDISLPVAHPATNTGIIHSGKVRTINENERDHIISVLRNCKGRIFGASGAAELLNVPPSTLRSKMKKLGIKKENID